jgi:hypothetical protein
LTKSEDEETIIIINRPGRSTYLEEKSVSTSGATPAAALYGGGAAGNWVQESSCCLRARLGELGNEHADIWWSIDQGDAAVEDLLPRVSHDSMFFFARYESRDLILSELKGRADNIGGGGSPPRIICAIILAGRGDVHTARELLSRQAQETRNPGHPVYVHALAERLGIGTLD